MILHSERLSEGTSGSGQTTAVEMGKSLSLGYAGVFIGSLIGSFVTKSENPVIAAGSAIVASIVLVVSGTTLLWKYIDQFLKRTEVGTDHYEFEKNMIMYHSVCSMLLYLIYKGAHLAEGVSHAIEGAKSTNNFQDKLIITDIILFTLMLNEGASPSIFLDW